MSRRRRANGEIKEDLEAQIGRSLAETERLNSPEHRAGEQARAAVRRRAATTGRGMRRPRAFTIALLILLAVIGLLGWLVALAG